jgi:hypothetical protein
MDEIRIPIKPLTLTLTAGTFTEIVFLDPTRPHTTVDDRGCPHCGGDYYDSGCEAPGCTGYACPDCGAGCDLDFLDAAESKCAQATAEEAGR